jgi:transcriptional regulator with XRE-family HTH domain
LSKSIEGGWDMQITLEAARVNRGYTQTAAAKKLDVAVGTLLSWEKGRTFPPVNKIQLIENVYGVTYGDIIFLPRNYG